MPGPIIQRLQSTHEKSQFRQNNIGNLSVEITVRNCGEPMDNLPHLQLLHCCAVRGELLPSDRTATPRATQIQSLGEKEEECQCQSLELFSIGNKPIPNAVLFAHEPKLRSFP